MNEVGAVDSCKGYQVGTDQCPALKQHYNYMHKTRCGGHCKNGTTKWKRFDCGFLQHGKCCIYPNPDHNSQDDYSCCSGKISGEKIFGTCNAESCPFSDYCNNSMAEVCKLTGNINLWFDGTGCSSYVSDGATGSTNQRVISGGRKVLRETIQNFFPKAYTPDVFKEESWDKKVKVAQENCRYYPDECQPILRNFCSTVTRKDVFENDDLKTLCGCFMPSEQYPYSGFVSLDCSMPCNGQDNIRSPDWHCDQTVCIIDNTTINEIDSQGDINLGQLCGGGANSTCLLKGMTVNQINSRVGGGINLEQTCQDCYAWIGGDSEDQETSVEDDGTIKPDPSKWRKIPCSGKSGIIPRRYLIFIGVGIIILIILILIGILIWALY